MGKKHCVEEIDAVGCGSYFPYSRSFSVALALHVHSVPACVGANLDIVVSCC